MKKLFLIGVLLLFVSSLFATGGYELSPQKSGFNVEIVDCVDSATVEIYTIDVLFDSVIITLYESSSNYVMQEYRRVSNINYIGESPRTFVLESDKYPCS